MEINDQEIPFEYRVFTLAFKEPEAISTFKESLPVYMVGAIHGQTGLSEFYQAILDFHDKTGLDPVDPIAFRSWLHSETDIYNALGGATGIDILMDTVLDLEMPTTEAVIKYLKHKADHRKQLDALQELQTLINAKGHKSDQDIERLNALTVEIRNLENSIEYNPYDAVDNALDIAKRAEELMEVPDFLPTPYKSLNKAMGYDEDGGGFFRGSVHAIVATSGTGKSTLAKNLMNHWCDTGYTVLFINFEEARAHWERILFTQVTGDNVYANSKGWNQTQRIDKVVKFREKLEEWGDRFMVRHDPDSSYFDDLERWLRDIIGHNDHVPDVVIIDTIQSLIAKGNGPRWGEYEMMMIRLERLAKEMNSVFIITAQQNTNAMKEGREVVQQSDIGGSITIVQKCAVILVITPKKLISDDDSEDELIMQLQIPKNRITGLTFSYDPPIIKYNDETKSYEPWEPVDGDLYEEVNLPENIFGEDFHV